MPDIKTAIRPYKEIAIQDTAAGATEEYSSTPVPEFSSHVYTSITAFNINNASTRLTIMLETQDGTKVVLARVETPAVFEPAVFHGELLLVQHDKITVESVGAVANDDLHLHIAGYEINQIHPPY